MVIWLVFILQRARVCHNLHVQPFRYYNEVDKFPVFDLENDAEEHDNFAIVRRV